MLIQFWNLTALLWDKEYFISLASNLYYVSLYATESFKAVLEMNLQYKVFKRNKFSQNFLEESGGSLS